MHRYRMELRHTTDTDGNEVQDERLDLEFTNHDDLFEIMERIKSRELFDDDTSAELVVGMKMLGEVMLRHRDSPLFVEFRDAFNSFMKKVKAA